MFFASPSASNLTHFQHVLSTSFQVSFFIRFSQIFNDLGTHSAPICKNKPFRKSFQKQGPPNMKSASFCRVRDSQRRRLACALLEQETIARARNVVRICVMALVPRNWSEMAVWEGFDCKSFKQKNRKNGKGRCRKHMVRDLTRPGQRPGVFFCKIENLNIVSLWKCVCLTIWFFEFWNGGTSFFLKFWKLETF